MSMSTLGQQLAAVANSNNNTGTIFSTSRRHEDAIGRGLSHSVQVGHSLVKNIYKPSIIYEDSKKANDVPLATIRENCVASLRQLEELDPEFGRFVNLLCNPNAQERGLLTPTQNQAIDKTIEELIYRLSLRMSADVHNNGNNSMSSCLHVIEFLLRKYDIHLRPQTACVSLLTMLPHHEEPFFLRLLQLIDVANMPEWTFLRPYAVPGARLGRSLIAGQVSKDVALLRSLGKLSQRNAKLPCCDKSLSFTAAVLVEALTLQTQRKGTMEEATCQALLPFVVAACRNHKGRKEQIWQNWGLILASAMVETGVLAAEPRNLLVTSIFEGLMRQKKIAEQSDQTTKIFIPLLCNGLTVALSLLMQDTPITDTDCEETNVMDCRLATLFSSSLEQGNVGFGSVGFSMGKQTFNILLRLDDAGRMETDGTERSVVADCIGRLYGLDGITEFKHWIASLLVAGWKTVAKTGIKTTKEDQMRKVLHLVLSLIKQPDLKQKFWKESGGSWIESYTMFVVSNTPLDLVLDKDVASSTTDTFVLGCAKNILGSLRDLQKLPYERGLAHALMHIRTKSDRFRCAEWLGLAKLQNDDYSSIDAEDNAENSLSETLALPPRVALEHVDPKIRVNAVAILLDEYNSNDSKDADEDGETIPQALLRRFLMDDDDRVAVVTAEALNDLLQTSVCFESTELGEKALESLHKWYAARNLDEKTKTDLLVYSCRFASIACRQIYQSGGKSVLWIRLVEALGALLAHEESIVSKEAESEIVFAFDAARRNSKGSKLSRQKALAFLTSDHALLGGFQRRFRTGDGAEVTFRRQLVGAVLESLVSSPARTPDVFPEAVEYCIWVLNTFPDGLNDSSVQNLSKFLVRSSDYVSSVPEKIHSIVNRLAAGDESTFQDAVAPFIKSVCNSVADKNSGNVTPLSVLMEIMLASDDKTSIQNLASVGIELAKSSPIVCYYAMAPAMALASYTDESVRALAVDLISSMTLEISSSKSGGDVSSVMSALGQYFADNKSSVVLEGPAFLPRAFSAVISNTGNAESARTSILNALLSSVCTSGAKEVFPQDCSFAKGWLGAEHVVGGYRSAICILQAAEDSGESAFPLQTRWGSAGKPILEAILDLENTNEVSVYVLDLILLAVRMLRGAKVSRSNSDSSLEKRTIISTGPASHGGRSRSYSFGSSDSDAYLRPYPESMANFVVSVLEANSNSRILEEMRKILFEYVLGSKSWQQEVFSRLDGKIQQRIVSGILATASETSIERAETTLFSMPLSTLSIAKLLLNDFPGETGLARMSMLYDYVGANVERLASENNVEDLLVSLYRQLSIMIKSAATDEAFTYAQQALLNALTELSQLCLERGVVSSRLKKGERLKSWMECLVMMLCGTEGGRLPKVSLRSQKLIFVVLATFCNCFPAEVVSLYLRIVDAYSSAHRAISEPKSLKTCFSSALPTFLKHCAAGGLTEVDLLNAFFTSTNRHDEKSRLVLYNSFVNALSTIPMANASCSSPIGSFVVAALAQEVHSLKEEGNQAQPQITALASQILSALNASYKIDALLTMQGFSKQMLFKLLGRAPTETDNLPRLSVEELCGEAFSETCSKPNNAYQKLCTMLTIAICDLTAILDLRIDVKNSLEILTKKLFLLWQDFLLMQSLCHSRSSEDTFKSMSGALGLAMSSIQNCLPSHVYVAFTTNLMKEGSTEDLRNRAIQLIVERCSSLTPAEPEAALFVEMIPSLVELLQSDTGNSASSKHLGHSIFAAIDVIGRNCFAIDSMRSKKGSSQVDLFACVLDKAANAIQFEGHWRDGLSFSDMSAQSRQVVSVAAICSSTALKIVGPRAVPVLSRLISSLLNILSMTCLHLKTAKEREVPEQNQARLVQLSILCALKSLAENLSLHLKQYLRPILISLALMPETFETDGNNQTQLVENEFNSLMVTIASCIPSRQLIPAVANAVAVMSSTATASSLLMIATNSIKSAKSGEVSSQANLVLETAFHGFEGVRAEDNGVIKACNDLILAFVMKLSEVQLRSLYKKLRSWRDDTDTELSEQRRLAFWSLSATLSKNLKTLFLPCLSMGFPDAVGELESAVSLLTKESKKSSDGRKKQKLGCDRFDKLQLATFESVLASLEVSLRWDAHNGGAWIREMDSQRFDALLRPLGKLIQCHLPSNQPNALYDRIVRGMSSSCGSVVGCIVALASAAGDEQLWKPLNHVVLQACSNRSRAEVRKAGVFCLFSLVKCIGEEYMVLIPECLPVLAELLEDSDEEVAGLAQDCIALSEELLGESLQDSLL